MEEHSDRADLNQDPKPPILSMSAMIKYPLKIPGTRSSPGPVFTNILILRIRIFLEFSKKNSKNKYFWYSLNSYS